MGRFLAPEIFDKTFGLVEFRAVDSFVRKLPQGERRVGKAETQHNQPTAFSSSVAVGAHLRPLPLPAAPSHLPHCRAVPITACMLLPKWNLNSPHVCKGNVRACTRTSTRARVPITPPRTLPLQFKEGGAKGCGILQNLESEDMKT